MKKVIIVALALAVIIGGVIVKVNYDNTHFMGYIYRNSGAKYDNGFAKGTHWFATGEKAIYSLDELRELGAEHTVRLTGLLGGPKGVAIELLDDTVLIVPGVGLGDHIAESYGLF